MASHKEDYYKVLGVHRDASDDEIKKAPPTKQDDASVGVPQARHTIPSRQES
jgi:hypothetical protein